MNDIIRKRKSIRKYDPAPLDAATLDAVRAQIGKLKPYSFKDYFLMLSSKLREISDIVLFIILKSFI